MVGHAAAVVTALYMRARVRGGGGRRPVCVLLKTIFYKVDKEKLN